MIHRLMALIERIKEIHEENPALVTAEDLRRIEVIGLNPIGLAPILHTINARVEEWHASH